MNSNDQSQNPRDVAGLVSTLANQGVLLAKRMERTHEALPPLLRAFRLARDHSLANLLPNLRTNLDVVLGLLNQKAHSLLEHEPDAVVALAKEIEAAASECELPARLQMAVGVRGIALQKLERLSEALSCFQMKEAVCRKSGNRDGLHRSLTLQAQAYLEDDKLDEALAKLEEKHRICEEAGDPKGMILALDMISQARVRKGDPEGALRSLGKLEVLLRGSDDKTKLAECLNQQALIHTATGNTEKSLQLRKEERRIYEVIGDRSGVRRSYCNEALVLHQLRDHAGAGSLYELVEKDCSQAVVVKEVANLYTMQAKFLFERGDCPSAVAVFKRQENICRKFRHSDGLIAALLNQGMLGRDVRLAEEALKMAKAEKLDGWVAQLSPIVEEMRRTA